MNSNHISGLNVSSHTLLVWILIGLVAGYITGKLMRGAGFGPLMDIIVGIIGAVIGGFIMIHLGYAGSGGFFYTVFVAVIGAVILTFLIRLVTGGRSRL
jgi:uncharacterized membrane protein YeaQ/YmgE (transglycosylase-associated protein family)